MSVTMWPCWHRHGHPRDDPRENVGEEVRVGVGAVSCQLYGVSQADDTDPTRRRMSHDSEIGIGERIGN